MENAYGECHRCGKSLTPDHECKWLTLEEVMEEFRKERGPSWDDEIAKARKWIRRQMRKAVCK